MFFDYALKLYMKVLKMKSNNALLHIYKVHARTVGSRDFDINKNYLVILCHNQPGCISNLLKEFLDACKKP